MHTKGDGGYGMLCHGTLAFTPERLPLGVLSLRLWARDPLKRHRRAPPRRERAIADKESQKWIDSVRAVAALKGRLPETRWVSVADREGDVFEFFTEAQALGVDLLVRASWNRCVSAPQAPLFATLAAAPLRLWGGVSYEPRPPKGVEPLDWKLLTSVPVTTAAQALERLEWYAVRWGIEQWHKILKSGCRIETRQLESLQRLQRLLTLYAVIAWRVLYATMLSRLAPQLRCTAILNEDEWQALYCRIHRRPIPPATAPPLRQAVRWIAKLGGFIGRKNDGEPGTQTLWRGFQELIAMTEMYRIMKAYATPPRSKRPHKIVGND